MDDEMLRRQAKKKKPSCTMLGLSITQLIIGSVLCAMGHLVMSRSMALSVVAAPLWGGIAAVLAGIIGVLSTLKVSGMKNTAMILSFVSFFLAIFVLVSADEAMDNERGTRRSCWDTDSHEFDEECFVVWERKKAIDGYIMVIAIVDMAISLIICCYGVKDVCCRCSHSNQDSECGHNLLSCMKDFMSALTCCRPQPSHVYLVLNQSGGTAQEVPVASIVPSESNQTKQAVIMIPLNLHNVMRTGQDGNVASENHTESH